MPFIPSKIIQLDNLYSNNKNVNIQELEIRVPIHEITRIEHDY